MTPEQETTLASGCAIVRSELRNPDTIALLDALEQTLLEAMRTVDKIGALYVGDNIFSRKVPDVPALRLVGGFQCDVDESGGAA